MTVTSINLTSTPPSSAQVGSTVAIAATIQNNDSTSHSVECRIIQGSTTLLDQAHTISPGAQYTFTTSLVMPSTNVTIQCQSLVQGTGGGYLNDSTSTETITATQNSGSYKYSIGQTVIVVQNPSISIDTQYAGLIGTVTQQIGSAPYIKYTVALGGGQRLAGAIDVYEVDLTVNAYTVTYTIQGPGTVSISSVPPDASPYAQGDVITVTATPNSGATFTGWYENGVLVSSNPVYSFNIESNVGLLAVFGVQATSYTLTVGIVGPGTIASNPPVGSIASGTSVTLTATPNLGDNFVGWYNGISILSTSKVYTFTMPAANLSYGAVFTSPSITVSPLSVVIGGTIVINAGGFKPNSTISAFAAGGTATASGTTDSSGNATLSMTLTGYAATSSCLITVTDGTSTQTAHIVITTMTANSFNITIAMSPTTGTDTLLPAPGPYRVPFTDPTNVNFSISATPATGDTFVSWEEKINNQVVESVTTPTWNVTLNYTSIVALFGANPAIIFTANFAPAGVVGPGTGVTPDGKYHVYFDVADLDLNGVAATIDPTRSIPVGTKFGIGVRVKNVNTSSPLNEDIKISVIAIGPDGAQQGPLYGVSHGDTLSTGVTQNQEVRIATNDDFTLNQGGNWAVQIQILAGAGNLTGGPEPTQLAYTTAQIPICTVPAITATLGTPQISIDSATAVDIPVANVQTGQTAVVTVVGKNTTTGNLTLMLALTVQGSDNVNLTPDAITSTSLKPGASYTFKFPQFTFDVTGDYTIQGNLYAEPDETDAIVAIDSTALATGVSGETIGTGINGVNGIMTNIGAKVYAASLLLTVVGGVPGLLIGIIKADIGAIAVRSIPVTKLSEGNAFRAACTAQNNFSNTPVTFSATFTMTSPDGTTDVQTITAPGTTDIGKNIQLVAPDSGHGWSLNQTGDYTLDISLSANGVVKDTYSGTAISGVAPGIPGLLAGLGDIGSIIGFVLVIMIIGMIMPMMSGNGGMFGSSPQSPPPQPRQPKYPPQPPQYPNYSGGSSGQPIIIMPQQQQPYYPPQQPYYPPQQPYYPPPQPQEKGIGTQIIEAGIKAAPLLLAAI